MLIREQGWAPSVVLKKRSFKESITCYPTSFSLWVVQSIVAVEHVLQAEYFWPLLTRSNIVGEVVLFHPWGPLLHGTGLSFDENEQLTTLGFEGAAGYNKSFYSLKYLTLSSLPNQLTGLTFPQLLEGQLSRAE